MGGSIDLTGQVFGKLIAHRRVGKDRHGSALWERICACGEIDARTAYSLHSSKAKSCRNCARANLGVHLHKHGMCYTPEYAIWKGMHDRCYNEKNEGFKNYGGRGIDVCPRWRAITQTDSSIALKTWDEDRSIGISPWHCQSKVDQ
jgi:hypothetical protein